jgi:hypothetical protein
MTGNLIISLTVAIEFISRQNEKPEKKNYKSFVVHA